MAMQRDETLDPNEMRTETSDLTIEPNGGIIAQSALDNRLQNHSDGDRSADVPQASLPGRVALVDRHANVCGSLDCRLRQPAVGSGGPAEQQACEQLALSRGKATGQRQRISAFETSDRSVALVFRRTEVEEATEEIISIEGIRYQASEELLDVFAGGTVRLRYGREKIPNSRLDFKY